MRNVSLALAGGLSLVAGGSEAATYGQTIWGLQQGTTSPAIVIWDGSQNVAIGTLNTLTHTFTVPSAVLQLSAPPPIGNVTPNTGAFTTLTTTGSIMYTDCLCGQNPNAAKAPIDLFTTPPAAYGGLSSDGAIFSFNSPSGHSAGDSDRASLYLKTPSSTRSFLDATSVQEGGLVSDFYNSTGAVWSWFPTAAYAAGNYLIDTAKANIYQTSAACTTGAGPGPSGTTTPQVDGTCSWNWIAPSVNSRKSAVRAINTMVPGSGRGWGYLGTTQVNTGGFLVGGGLSVGAEYDVTNLDRDCIPTGQTCKSFGLILGGTPNANVNSIGFYGSGATGGAVGPIGGASLYHWGMYLEPGFAKDIGAAFETGATNEVVIFAPAGTSQTNGIQLGGGRSGSDVTAGGTSTLDAWTDSGVRGRDFVRAIGSYADAVINTVGHTGANFFAKLAGLDLIQWSTTWYSAAGTALPTCNAGAKGTLGIVSDALAPTYNGAYVSGGAVTVPVFCDGTSWKTH